MERISKYISYLEATKSETAIRKGIVNVPNAKQLRAMGFVARNVFDPLRERVGGPLYASSFFWVKKLNTAIGGAKKSQHMNGEAIDIDCDKYGVSDNKTIFHMLKDDFIFDQLIWEHGDEDHPEWVHVSGVDENVAGRKNRGEVLRAFVEDGKVKYIPFDYN